MSGRHLQKSCVIFCKTAEILPVPKRKFPSRFNGNRQVLEELIDRVFLKSLEIFGFKSFPDRVRVEFAEGITGAVK